MPFHYLRDPLFLISVAAYLVNRFLFKHIWQSGFVHAHFNDLLCIPLLVPIMLWVARMLRLRRHDFRPTTYEIMIPIIVWTILFEILLPMDFFWSAYAVADPFDVFYYCLGGLIANVFWLWRYAPKNQSDTQ